MARRFVLGSLGTVKTPRTYRGIWYYPDFQSADRVLANLKVNGPDPLPDARIVSYGRGYAIQSRPGSHYFGPAGFAQ